VLLYDGAGWYAAVRADLPSYTEGQLSGTDVRLPGRASDGPVADLTINGGNAAQAVLGPVDPAAQGRLVRFDAAPDAPRVVTRETPITGPLDALGDVAPDLFADSAGAAPVTYVLRTRTEGATVELTAVRAGQVTRRCWSTCRRARTCGTGSS
jgi:hypothetical protein